MRRRTVIIADDDRELVDLLTIRCQRLGLEVDTAFNAMTALRKIEQAEPDLAIVDVNMPLGNGLALCEMMASHERLKQIPVIVLTGNTANDTVRRCHDLCAYWVPKCPDVWGRLEPLVTEILGTPKDEKRLAKTATD